MAEYSLLFMSLIDPLHNGAGEGLGLIDRPIIRERMTLFPIIQPSSIKGVLRDVFNTRWGGTGNANKVIALFGPEPGHGDSHAGAISFGEGKLFAFPIRSFKGCFIWATSPLILYRFKERITIAGKTLNKLDALLSHLSTINKPMICEGSQDLLLVGDRPTPPTPDNRKLMLEEFSYGFTPSNPLKEFAEEIAEKIFDPSSYLTTEFKNKLIVLHEDLFRYFVSNATEIMPNIRIGEDGVTEEGSLRHTEYLPRDSILYCLITYEGAKKPTKSPYSYDIASLNIDKPSGVKTNFETELTKIKYIQIGGDETTGKGLVNLKIFT